MDENARKRKREADESSEIEGIVAEKPLRVLKNAEMQAKKQKRGNQEVVNDNKVAKKNNGDESELSAEAVQKAKAEKRKQKRLQKRSKEEAKAANLKAKKARKEQRLANEKDATTIIENEEGSSEEDDDPRTGDVDNIDITGMLNESEDHTLSTATPSPTPPSPTFDASTINSGLSSVSSIVPPIIDNNKPQTKEALKKPAEPKTNPEELKIRLQNRIEELRAARKADGLNGKPARNRQELMEARRKKEEERRAHKKELRQKAKEEERRKQELIISRGSPLLNPPSKKSIHRDSEQANNFSFGRVTFPDGHASAELSTILPTPKTKGPQDPQTALQAAQNKESRLRALDPTKQSDIAEKDLWLNARKRAHGEAVRDDTSLLKKTLKRKEKAKKKSEKEWGARVEGVAKGIEGRQKRREENLKTRRDGKGKGKPGGKKGKAKVKPRPGFEGSFRARGKGGM